MAYLPTARSKDGKGSKCNRLGPGFIPVIHLAENIHRPVQSHCQNTIVMEIKD